MAKAQLRASKKRRAKPLSKKARKANPKKSKKSTKEAKGNKKKQDRPSKAELKASRDIFNPLNQLSGKQLRRFAKAITNAEYNPQLRGLTEQINSLVKHGDFEVGNLERLGSQATGNIQSYYQSLAQAEAENLNRQTALGNRLKSEVGEAGTQAAQNIQQAGQTATSNLSQPSSAREELQAMIAAQQGRQSREQQALAAAATGQAGNYEGLTQAMAQANQMRGGTNVSNTARQTLADVGKTQISYNEDIRRALAERAGLAGEAGQAMLKNLLELRGGEREYYLGKGALGIKQQEAQGDTSYRKFALKQQRISGRQDAKSRKGQKQLANIYGAQKRQQQQFALGYLQAQQGSAGKKDADRWKEALDLLRASPRKPKAIWEKRKTVYGELVNRGFNSREARLAVKRYTRKYRKKNKGKNKGLSAAGQAIGKVF